MKFIDEAFAQLSFAWKLYHYALEGHVDLEKLDIPISFQDEKSIFVLPDQIFTHPDQLILALENSLCVAFGAAAITLNRCREEAGVRLADPIVTEIDQFSAVAYQIRNSFAHDISNPCWCINKPRFRRKYSFGGINIDLTNVHGKRFEYADIGGPDTIFHMKSYTERNLWPQQSIPADGQPTSLSACR